MKVDFRRESYLSLEKINGNKAYAHSLCLPDARQIKAGSRRLAVIGGGPSIEGLKPEIAGFDGDRWAINGAYHWCKSQDINATFFSLDQTEYMRGIVKGVETAILSSACDPAVFDALNGANVSIVDIGHGEVLSGSSSATGVPFLALLMGYCSVTFFGCESSYGAMTHAYEDEPPELGVGVLCNGNTFSTSAQMFMQAQELSALITAAPHVLGERSGGLLRAMIESGGEYDMVSVSPALQSRMTQTGMAA